MIEKIKDIWDEHRNKIIIIGLVIGILVSLFVPTSNAKSENKNEINQYVYSKGESSTPSLSKTTNSNVALDQLIYVDVKGAVLHPGAYKMKANQRIGDVINKAGGLKEDADENQINLAKRIVDQMVIYVPGKGEKRVIDNDLNQTENLNETSATIKNENNNEQTNKVNLNSATIEQLKGLDGIGEKKAQKILDYRQQHGGFKKVDELKNVDGIGDKSYERLATQVCV